MAASYKRQASWPTRISFSVGSSSEAILGVAFNSFNFFFYNQILGLSGSLSGLAITIALVIDAVSDPFIGSLSDRWRSRWGRRHPFMFAAPLPVFICFFFIYSPPDGIAQVAWLGVVGMPLFLWFMVFVVLFRTAMTLFHVPHLAMGAELSTDYQERTAIMSVSGFFGMFGGVATSFIAFRYVFAATPEFENGLFNAAVYPVFAMVAAGIGVAIMILSAGLTMNQIPRMPKAPADLPPFKFRHVLAEMWQAWQNPNYRMLLLGLFFLSATLGIRETIGLHMNVYFWELLPEQLSVFIIFVALFAPLAFVVTPILHRMFDKRATIIGGVIFLAIVFVIPVTFRLLGWFPENHSPMLMPTLIVFVIVGTLTGIILTISVASSLADIADEHELTTGRRQEGIFYSARTFFAKAISGFGHLLAGIAIDVIGFPVGQEPGTIDPDKIMQLGLVDGPIGAIGAVIAIAFYWRYSITRERHQEIQAELEILRVERGQAPPPQPAGK